MTNVTVTVNGTSRSAEVEARTLLVEFLRNKLNLTGTHVGCDTSQCGACTVHLNGKPVKSCTMLAVQADGQNVTTIEGVAPGSDLHPMQAAFKECHGLQCGFCTPGMVMSALGIIARHQGRALDEKTVRQELEGNLCRCTGYQGIVNAVLLGAKNMGVKVA
ncbi:MAG: (2Fe-2S)-binding protein [Rhodospirillaceae bacterium]|nr:(2Fe-2S)-binding protein [Rhodospirillaceae bacterium]